MTNWQRARFTVFSAVAFAVAFTVWSLLLPALDGVDGLWRLSPPPEQHWLGQIGSAIAIVSLPVVIYVVLLGLALWASRRQLTSLAGALVMAVALSFGASTLATELFARERPGSAWDYLITQQGYAYPAAHTVAATAGGIMVVVLVTVSRRSRFSILVARVLGPAVVAVVAVDRVLMGASRISDVIGGILLGGLTATLASLICGVHVPRTAKEDGKGRRAIIVYNPTKVLDQTVFKDLVERRLVERGWDAPVWLSTTADDPGRAMARTALRAEPDLIMVAGGDGTVRVVCGALAETDGTLAILPSGTGNLLAGNMGIPTDLDRALDVALDGRTGQIDVLHVSTPGRPDDHAVVMCGVGVDAAILNDTDEDLKRQIGVAAYVAAALNHVKVRPVRTVVRIDDREPIESDASLTMVCNVSDLQAGLTLMPEASANDGILDVLVASPSNRVELTAMASAVLAQTSTPDTLRRETGRTVRIELADEQLYELDGDVIGKASELDFRVLAGALSLRLPR
ncbi:phosphatase PAP2 family protein [Tessaracoccus sp. OS52]|uniref:diacylglycerol kinase family protein n=1 Tax=Tessaracoccus sp. OS52 TaxID=2886691 RepID=UPI001D0F4AFB|nr:diacylglycerol kinase family protein [Tessaracoccus sp. OS52]MCC2594558.1 phosphatase PAP2 family protein [Tessaracoccus sp. OS52]